MGDPSDKNKYTAYFKECVRMEETLRKENAIRRGGQLTDAERAQAISGLHSTLRPRPVFDAVPRAVAEPLGTVRLDPDPLEQVRLVGLSGRAEYNGMAGVVIDRMPDASGRIKVRLIGPRDG